MISNEENGRPSKTDGTEASDESPFEEQSSRRSSCAEQIVQKNNAGEIARVAASLMRDGRDEIEQPGRPFDSSSLHILRSLTFETVEISKAGWRVARRAGPTTRPFGPPKRPFRLIHIRPIKMGIGGPCHLTRDCAFLCHD